MADVEVEEKNKPKELTVEQMLPHIGDNGTFQKLLVVGFTITLFVTSMQPVLCTFITLAPDWRCVENSTECTWKNMTFPAQDERRCNMSRSEWKYIADKDFSIVTQFDVDCERKSLVTLFMAIFFVGWGMGAIVCGWVVDRHGRRIIFLPAMITIFVLGFASPFASNVYIVIAFRFFIGFSFPGLLIQSQVVITEFVGTSFRHIAIGVSSSSFNVAWVLLGVKAYYLQNWKYLSIVCTAPYLPIFLFYFFIPESARWLHLKNRHEEAMIILRRIAKWNNRTLPDNITLASNHSTITVHSGNSNIFHLFSSPKLATRTCVLMFVWFSCALSSYGLQFSAGNLGGTVYLNFMLLSAAGVPAAVAGSTGLKMFGRKITTLSHVILAGVTCFVIAGLPSNGVYRVVRLVLGIFGKFCVVAQIACLYTWSPEMYPTSMRAVAMGVVQLSARVGSGLSPLVVIELARYGQWIPFVVIGVVSVLAGGFGFLLPETKGMQLKENEENS